ncbi:hypothetical protein PFISCL1PPCAC_373, partial [Pristionchus fissidentatus]
HLRTNDEMEQHAIDGVAGMVDNIVSYDDFDMEMFMDKFQELVEEEMIWDVEYAFDENNECNDMPLDDNEWDNLYYAVETFFKEDYSDTFYLIVERRENREVPLGEVLDLEALLPKTLRELFAYAVALTKANGHLRQRWMRLMLRTRRGGRNRGRMWSTRSMKMMKRARSHWLRGRRRNSISVFQQIQSIIERRQNLTLNRGMKYEDWSKLETTTLRELKAYEKAWLTRLMALYQKNPSFRPNISAKKWLKLAEEFSFTTVEKKDYFFDSDDEDNARPMNYIERAKLRQQKFMLWKTHKRTSKIVEAREGVRTDLADPYISFQMLQPKTLREIEAYFDSELAKDATKKGKLYVAAHAKEICTKKLTSEDAKDYSFDSDDENNQRPMSRKECIELYCSYTNLSWTALPRFQYIIENHEKIEINMENGFILVHEAQFPEDLDETFTSAFDTLQPKTQRELATFIESEKVKEMKEWEMEEETFAEDEETEPAEAAPAAPTGGVEELVSSTSNASCVIS